MTRAILLLLCIAVGARGQDAPGPNAAAQPPPPPAGSRPLAPQQPAQPEPTRVVAELPPIAGQLAPKSVAPNALPPVTAQLFHIGGKLEVEPLLSISLGDPFYRTYSAGIRAEQHIGERWSLGMHLLAGASSIAAPVELCGGVPCFSPAGNQLRSTPGQLQLMTGFEVSWAPAYGKLSLVGERTIHFDAYVSLGPELVRERIASDAIAPIGSRWNVGGRASIGERVFLTDRLAIRAGLSELVYPARVRGRTEVERKLWFEGGLTWLFGAAR